METAALGINVDTSKVKEATEALERLAHAATMARAALQNLGFTLSVEMMIDQDDEPEAGEIN